MTVRIGHTYYPHPLLVLCIGWKGQWICCVTRGRERGKGGKGGEGRGREGRGGRVGEGGMQGEREGGEG